MDAFLECPNGQINIISAEYGRPTDDHETSCNPLAIQFNPCSSPLSDDGCVFDALNYAKNVCQGEYRLIEIS